MMRTEPEKRIKVEEVYGHEVVTRARSAMERAYVTAKGRGTSVFCASPLASVGDGFLEEILGRGDVEMEDE
jgi:mitosis inhibitor protein kinase SWE1